MGPSSSHLTTPFFFFNQIENVLFKDEFMRHRVNKYEYDREFQQVLVRV